MKTRGRDAIPLTLKMEGDQQTRISKSHMWQGNGFSSRVSKKEYSSVDILLLTQWNLYQTSNLHNYQIINVQCFRPLSFWWFVIVTIRNKYKHGLKLTSYMSLTSHYLNNYHLLSILWTKQCTQHFKALFHFISINTLLRGRLFPFLDEKIEA